MRTGHAVLGTISGSAGAAAPVDDDAPPEAMGGVVDVGGGVVDDGTLTLVCVDGDEGSPPVAGGSTLGVSTTVGVSCDSV